MCGCNIYVYSVLHFVLLKIARIIDAVEKSGFFAAWKYFVIGELCGEQEKKCATIYDFLVGWIKSQFQPT